MNLNGKQVIAIVIAILSVLMVSTSQLNDLFGPAIAKYVVSTAGLLNLILGSVMAALTGQGAMINEVRAMPGVEHIEVNAQANKTLAAIAVDPKADKIAPTPAAMQAVTQTAKGT